MGDVPQSLEPTVDLGRAMAILLAVEPYPAAARLQQARQLCAGNEVLFVGTSTSGSADSHYFVESGTGSIPSSGGNIHTDNVTDAVWTDTGRTLYVTQSIQPQVSRAVWDGTNAT